MSSAGVPHDVVDSEAGSWLGHVLLHRLGHLVAGTADVRPDPRLDRRGAEVTHPGHAGADDVLDEPLAAGVCGPEDPRGRVGQQHRHAVGDADHQHHVGTVGDQGVALLARAAGLDHGVPVHLVHVGQGGAGGEVVEQQREVAAYGLGVVVADAGPG